MASLKEKFVAELDYLRRLGRVFARRNPALEPFLGVSAKDPGVQHLLEGFAFLTARLRLKIDDDFHSHLNGSPVAGIGHQVSCPQCGGVSAIEEGSKRYKVNGIPVALHGMKTGCGARLIASGAKGQVDG